MMPGIFYTNVPKQIGDVPDVPTPEGQFEKDVIYVLDKLMTQLIEKNRKYGDAALNPKRTFARCDPIELINVRMDDKLSRIAARQNDDDEDPELDLLGYLVLKQIALMRKTDARLKEAADKFANASARLAEAVEKTNNAVKKTNA
jgi:hypothetical protein